eukprot:gb/GECH01010746.1/.p1 GENE.gb/GECH01010746.1/~~gb/GECH01010746.1/.p1  ORF type:complete len:874 (+),score=159.14 gb/GECH01010746.1/:1-2622(+)
MVIDSDLLFRLTYVLDIAQDIGQLPRLQNQGTYVFDKRSGIHLFHTRDKSILSEAYLKDPEFALKLINHYGFNPNTSCDYGTTQTQHSKPLILQLLEQFDLAFENFKDFYNNIVESKKINFNEKYHNVPVVRWLLFWNTKKLLEFALENGAFFSDPFNFDVLPTVEYIFISKPAIEQATNWMDLCDSSEGWDYMCNNPDRMHQLARRMKYKEFPALSQLASKFVCKFHKPFWEFLMLRAVPLNTEEEENNFKSGTFLEVLLLSYELTNHANDVARIIIEYCFNEDIYEREGIDRVSKKLLGLSPVSNRYMAHVLATTRVLVCNDNFTMIYLLAMNQLPSIDQRDVNGKTLLHHVDNQCVFNYVLGWIYTNLNSKDTTTETVYNKALKLKQLLLEEDQVGNLTIHLLTSVHNSLPLGWMMKIIPDILFKKNREGLTFLGKSCIEGNHELIEEVKLEFTNWHNLFKGMDPLIHADYPDEKYSFYASTQSKMEWETNEDYWNIFLECADFSLLTPDDASLLHAFTASTTDDGDSQSFETLIKQCLNSGIDINQKTKKRKQTALHLAAETNNTKYFMLLVRNGANALSIPDIRNRTPFSYANIITKQQFIKYMEHERKTDVEKLYDQIPIDILCNIVDQRVYELSNNIEQYKVHVRRGLDLINTQVTFPDIYNVDNYPWSHYNIISDSNQDHKCLTMSVPLWAVYMGSYPLLYNLFTNYNYTKLKKSFQDVDSITSALHVMLNVRIKTIKKHSYLINKRNNEDNLEKQSESNKSKERSWISNHLIESQHSNYFNNSIDQPFYEKIDFKVNSEPSQLLVLLFSGLKLSKKLLLEQDPSNIEFTCPIKGMTLLHKVFYLENLSLTNLLQIIKYVPRNVT